MIPETDRRPPEALFRLFRNERWPGISPVEVEEIDQLNILPRNHVGEQRAVAGHRFARIGYW